MKLFIWRGMAAAVALICAVATGSGNAVAAEPAGAATAGTVAAFSIEAQDLSSALLALGRQSRRNVLFDPAQAAGKRSQKVERAGSFEDALQQILAGTGLKFEIRPDGSAMVLPQQQASLPSPPPPPRAASRPSEFAQVEEIVVTSTKTGAANLQKTPIAISAFSARDLDRSLISNTRDLVEFTPNLNISQNNTFAQIYIRGVGSSNIFNGSDPSSTVHVDGVYYARPFAQFTSFLDVDHIEVLRGPQGTLYGRNSVGGTINVISRLPTDTTEAKARLDLGNYGLVRGEAYISGAIVPGKVQASLSGMYSRYDTRRENIVPGVGDIDDQNMGSGRAQVRVQVSDSVDAITRLDFYSSGSASMGYAKTLLPYEPVANSILGDFSKVALNAPNRTTMRGYGFSEDITWNIQDNLKLKSLTAYRRSLTKSFVDSDASARDVSKSNIEEPERQFSQELNLNGTWRALDYVAGLYAFTEQGKSLTYTLAPLTDTMNVIRPKTQAQAYAAFAQGTWHLTDQLSATAGFRYSQEKKRFTQLVGPASASTGVFRANSPTRYVAVGKYYAGTPKFGLQYSAAENVLLFASVTRGFKSGGFNMTSADPNGGFAPETLWSYEAGVKTDWLDRRLRLNLTGFKYNYSNLQVQTLLGNAVSVITNAADASIKGLELEARTTPVPGLDLSVNLAYLDAVYSSYPAAVGPGGRAVDASGNRLNDAPKFSASMAAQYDFELSRGDVLYARTEFSWKTRQYFVATNDPIQSQGAYGVLNASIGYAAPSADWRVSLWGRNLLDRQYMNGTNQSAGTINGRPGDPRTFGVQLSWKM